MREQLETIGAVIAALFIILFGAGAFIIAMIWILLYALAIGVMNNLGWIAASFALVVSVWLLMGA